MKPISPKQIQIIKIAQKQLGIDDDTYREMLYSNFRVKSCTKLSYFQAGRMIALLKKKGFKIKPKKACGRLKDRVTGKSCASRPRHPSSPSASPRQAGNMVHLASQAELQKIEVLSWLVHWRVKDGFTKWMSKRFSIERIKTAQEAYRIIEGLKKMFENQMKAEYGDDWTDLMFDDPAIMRYIEEHKTAM